MQAGQTKYWKMIQNFKVSSTLKPQHLYYLLWLVSRRAIKFPHNETSTIEILCSIASM